MNKWLFNRKLRFKSLRHLWKKHHQSLKNHSKFNYLQSKQNSLKIKLSLRQRRNLLLINKSKFKINIRTNQTLKPKLISIKKRRSLLKKRQRLMLKKLRRLPKRKRQKKRQSIKFKWKKISDRKSRLNTKRRWRQKLKPRLMHLLK